MIDEAADAGAKKLVFPQVGTIYESIAPLGYVLIRIAIDNPLNGILPDFSIFGVQFTELWQKLIAGIWALCIIVAIIALGWSLGSMAAATAGSNPADYKLGRTRAIWAGISLGALAAFGVIVGAILAVFG